MFGCPEGTSARSAAARSHSVGSRSTRLSRPSGCTSWLHVAGAEAAHAVVAGGLAHVTVLTTLIFGGISGSAVATIAGVGTIIIQAMRDAGYRPVRWFMRS